MVSIPVIDLAAFHLSAPSAAQERLHALEEVRKACEEWGFFQVLNHGLDPALLDEALDYSRQFFQLPVEEKQKLATQRPPFGFVNQSGVRGVLDRKEHLLFYAPENPAEGLNVWPEKPEGYKPVVEKLMQEAGRAARFLTAVILESFGLPKDRAESLHEGVADTFIMPFYPESPPSFAPEVVLSQHRDGGILTILSQLNDVPGLQVLKDGEWITVEPEKGTLVVNIADVLQVWTNGRCKSVLHRVAANQVDRYSCAYFYIPSVDAEVAPLPEFVSELEPARYRSFRLGEYLQKRFENRKLINNKNAAEEVTIEYYAVA